MNFNRFRVWILASIIVSPLLLAPVAANAFGRSSFPSGYTKWKDGKEFAYKWITKIPKDDYYRGTWQGVTSTISVIYANGFSCSPKMWDGSTNSVEVSIDVIRTGNKGFSGTGSAQTIRHKGPFRIDVRFYGAPKGYGKLVRQVKLKSIECRM